MTGIYKISSIRKPGKYYIGSAKNLNKRWKTHLRNLQNNSHHSRKLQNHYNKYGEADLKFELLLECEESELIIIEQFFFDTQNCFFNVCRNAGNWSGNKHTKETKAHLSQINKGNKNYLYTSEEAKERRRALIKIKFNTDEFKQMQSERMKKFHGILTPEGREKIRATSQKKHIKHILNCKICGNLYKLSLTDYIFCLGKFRRTCSKKCSKILSGQSLAKSGKMKGLNNPQFRKPKNLETIRKWKESRGNFKHSAITKIRMSRTKINKKVCRLKVDQRSLFN